MRTSPGCFPSTFARTARIERRCCRSTLAGVRSAEAASLFEPFYRGALARERRVPGSGLGLSVVRQVAEAHGGRAVLDLEAKALAHIERVDPELPIARQLGSGTSNGHIVRLFERMPGRSGARDLDDVAVSAFAATNA